MNTDFSTDLMPHMPQASASSSPGRTINVMRMLRLRLRLMTVVFLAVAVPVVVAVWLLVPKEFTASDKLQFSSRQLDYLMNEKGVDESQYAYEMFTSAALVTDPHFLLTVLSDPKVRDLPEIRDIRSAQDRANFLRDRLQARQIPRTEFLEVTGTFGREDTARTVVTVVVAELEESALDKERASQNLRAQSLQDLEESLKEQYTAKHSGITRMREKIQAPYLQVEGVGASGDVLLTSLNGLEAQRMDVENQLRALTLQAEMLQKVQADLKGDADREVWELQIEAQAASDPEAAMYLRQAVELRSQLANSPWRDDSPQVKNIRDQLNVAETNYRKSLREARQAAVNVRLAEAETQQARLTEAKAAIEEKIASTNDAILKERADATGLIKDNEEIRKEELELQQVFDRLWQVQQELFKENAAAKQPPRVSRPSMGKSAPVRPDHGKQLKLAFVAVVAAGGLGLGAGLLREMTDQQLHGSEDVSYVTPLPVLAAIPHTSADRLPAKVDAATLSRDHPGSTTAEEFRRILSRIIYPPEGAVEIKTILVTSPSKGDGKTSAACNLATALAQASRRVLVVDVCARRPGVEKALGLEPGPGLAEVLAGEYAADEVVRPTASENVVVMGPGYQGQDLTGKLASRQALEFFEQAEGIFDHVIIDTPPCLLMSDAKLLAPVMDGVVLVVGIGVSTTGMMRRCLIDLQQGNANVLGIVVNGVRPTRGGYMRRNLNEFYSYGGDGAARSNGNGHGNAGANGAPDDDDELPMILLADERPGVENGQDKT